MKQCPVCKRNYTKSNHKVIHFIFPKQWYRSAGPIAEICVQCHREFERENDHQYVWTTKECWERWYSFLLRRCITDILTGIIYLDRRE